MNKRLLTALLIIVTTVLILVLGSCNRDVSSNPPINETTAEATQKADTDTTAKTTEKSLETEPPAKNSNKLYSISIKEGEENYFVHVNDIYATDYYAGETVSIIARHIEYYKVYLLVNETRIAGGDGGYGSVWFRFTMPKCDVVLSIELEQDPNAPEIIFIKEPHKDINMPNDEWQQLFDYSHNFANTVYVAVTALSTGSSERFAKAFYVLPEIYSDIEGIKIGEYSVSYEDIPAKNDPSKTAKYPVLELEVLESENEFFSVGHHKIVFDYGLKDTFTRYEDFAWYTEYVDSMKLSPAELYVAHVKSDSSFESILGEDRRHGGLAEFILFRLNTVTNRENDYENGFTEDEIRAYAEKYLGVDGSTIKFSEGRTHVCPNGTHQVVGRGGSTYICDFVSEEIRDGITVVTVDFYADASKTMLSRTVEFHLKMIDGEYSPVKTVILKDSEFSTEYYST